MAVWKKDYTVSTGLFIYSLFQVLYMPSIASNIMTLAAVLLVFRIYFYFLQMLFLLYLFIKIK